MLPYFIFFLVLFSLFANLQHMLTVGITATLVPGQMSQKIKSTLWLHYKNTCKLISLL